MTNANNETGSKYLATKELDIAAIAKLVRADIAAEIKEGKLPLGLKCSVKISRYAGGQSLGVTVTAFPGQVRGTEERYSPEAKAVYYRLEAIRQAYNYDRSDPQTDYYNVRFYGSVGFDCPEPTAVDLAFAARARAEQAEAHVAECDARIAELAAAQLAAEARAQAARVARDATLAEMSALVGCFAGQA